MRTPRIMALLLCLLMVVGMMAACTGTTTPTTSTTAPTAAPSATAAATATSDAATAAPTATPAAATDSWLQDTSPITLSMFINESYNDTWNEGSKIFDQITKITGVSLDISSSAGVDGDDKLNALLASNSLPDFVVDAFWRPSFQTVLGCGQLQDLNKLIDQYAPDARNYLPQSMINWYKLDDGSFYLWMNYFYASEFMKKDSYLVSNNGCYVARKDIMDQLGIKAEDFSTVDGMYNALVKVQNSGIKIDGQDIIPTICTVYNDNPFYVAFGLDVQEDDAGIYLPIWRNSKYLESFKDFSKLWNAGLVYKDQFTSEDTQQFEAIATGRCFLINSGVPVIEERLAAMQKKDPKCVYVPVEMPRASDGKDPAFASTGTTGWLGTGISKNCKTPGRAIQFMTFMNSTQGMLLNTYGVEGAHYNMVDGHVQYTDQYKKAVADGTKEVTGLMPFFGNPVYLLQEVQPLKQLDTVQWRLDVQKYFSKYTYNEIAFTNLDPTDSDLLAIRNKCNEIMNRAEPQMAMAKDDAAVEKVYKDAMAQLDAAGYQKLVDYQAKKFASNKEKLGVKYGYPPRNK